MRSSVGRIISAAAVLVVVDWLAAASALSAGPGRPRESGLPPTSANLIVNGDFEKGTRGWVLHSGAAIVAQKAGHCLRGAAGAFEIADTVPDCLSAPDMAKHAGEKLTLSFDVWGAPEAHPGITLLYRDKEGKSQSANLVWKTTWTEINIKPEQEPKRHERVITLPPDAAQVLQLRIFNAAREGVIYFDNLSLTPGDVKEKAAEQRAQVIAGLTRQWEGVTFANGEELLELANTCNFLVCQWARTLSLIHDARRTAAYAGEGQYGDSIKPLEQRLSKYRDRLTALREFYIAEFSKKYGSLYTYDAPWRFYRHNNQAGRAMEVKVMKAKSRKEPFVRFEGELAAIQADASGLLRQMQDEAGRKLAFKPLPITPYRKLDRSFDKNGRPTQLIWGATADQYRLFAYQWVDAEVQVMLDFRPDYKAMTAPDGFIAFAKESLAPFKAKGFLRPFFATLSVWLDPEFQKMIEDNPEDCLEWSEDGVCRPRRIRENLVRYQFQCLNPKVMSELERQYTAISKIAKDHSDVVQSIMFDSEPVFWLPQGRFPSGKPVGYSPRFRKALQNRLQEKFGTVEKLNASWKSRYASFADISLPTQATMLELKPEDIPLIYEYRKFRKEYFADAYDRIYRAIKKGSDLPVINGSARDDFNGLSNLEPFDTLRNMKAQDLDCHHHCAEGGIRNDWLWVYHQSVASYAGDRRGGSDEYYPTHPEMIYWKWKKDPIVLFHRTIQNIAKDMAHGMVYINSWIRLEYPGNEEVKKGSAETRSGDTLMDEHWGSLPYLQKRMADGGHDLLFYSRSHRSGLAMLAPYDATMVCHPDGRVAVEGIKLHEFLSDRYRDYQCVPEQLILSGEEPLTKFKVLIAPYTLWAQEKLQQKLLDWTAQGNTLIAIGPLGFWNEYGQDSRKFINKVFGKVPMTPAKKETFYTFKISQRDIESSGKAKVEYSEGGNCRIASAACGKGRVWLTDASIETLRADAKRIIHKAIQEKMGDPAASCTFGRFFLFTRQDIRNDNRYLIAVNKDVNNRSDDTIFAEGDFKRPVDLGVPGGFPISAQRRGGFTSFNLSLAPGEAAYIALGPYRTGGAKATRPIADGRYADEREDRETKAVKELTLTIFDKNGNLIPKIRIQVVGKSKRTGQTAFDHVDLPVNDKGQAVFAVPVGEQYDLIVYDKEMNAEYSVTDVDLARQREYRVTFALFRADKK